MKVISLVLLSGLQFVFTSGHRELSSRPRVESRDGPDIINSCPNDYAVIDSKLYDKFIASLTDAVKKHPPGARKRDSSFFTSRPRSAKFPRGSRGGSSGYAGRNDGAAGSGFTDAFRVDGRGQRSYYDDYGYGYDSGSQYDRLLGDVSTDETFQEVMAKGCWWMIKAQFERLKEEALYSAKRHFRDYINRVAKHGGEWLWESVSGSTMMYWKRLKTPRKGSGKRDTSSGINIDTETEDLGFAMNMEVQFRNGQPPPGAPEPMITKILNIVDDDFKPLQGHVEGFWRAESYIGGIPHPRRDNMFPRDDPFDNQCHFSSWDAFKSHIRYLYETVVVPTLLSDASITGMELNLMSPGYKAIFKGWQGGSTRVRFWVSPEPKLSDTATFQKVNFEDAPNCLSSPAELQSTSLKGAECYVANEQTKDIKPPTQTFWNKVSDACRQAFHGSTNSENHSPLHENMDKPKTFDYYDDPDWAFEYINEQYCETPFLCSVLFGNSGDGKRGFAAKHWDECSTKDFQGVDQYAGGLRYVNLANRSPSSGDLKRQNERLDDISYQPCGVMNIFPQKSGKRYQPAGT